ncbi:unnamed protein product [Cyprideis torosa]|uniref:Uncharacterized protein n=1 Tax=Cyprideis torosa TaxID=163714 RepID=A0A7R8ZJ12_9CRUS|nr:unnamed protein product [Cyprideis torosa]CAG0887555.1 unnamed protein product [Cyprideis torosa]
MREKPNQVVSDSGQLSVENAAPPTADREVPTISITSDTAYGAGEAYTILDGSIAHIQRLQQTIQRMRQIQPSFYDPAAPGRSDWSSTKRNSTSCPSLATEHTSLGTGLDITEIDLDITNCQRDFLLNNNRFGDVNYGIGEIRDGAAGTRRSHSLSNSESELEETFPPPGIPLLSSGSPSRTAGDFDEIDVGSHRSFNSNIPPSLAHRSNRGKGGKQGVIHHASFVSPQGGGPIPMHAGRTFPVNRNLNLAMHKSISTPSIHHAPPEGRYRSTTGIHPGQPLVPNAPLAGESGSDSDGDEPATLKGFSRQVGPLAPGIGLNLQGQQFTRDSSLSEESVGKRRKRSSIFFKKKKEKERGLLCNSGSRPPDLRKPSGHAFRVIYSSKEICDSCQRPLFGNIRSPLQCQSCSATVHEACRDDVLLECNGGVAWHPPTTKSKSLPKTPSSHHVGGGAGLKQSSTPGFGLRSVHSSSGSLFGRKTLGGHSLSSASMSTLTTSSWGMNSRETTRLMDDFETNSEETIEETYARFFGEGAVETNIVLPGE